MNDNHLGGRNLSKLFSFNGPLFFQNYFYFFFFFTLNNFSFLVELENKFQKQNITIPQFVFKPFNRIINTMVDVQYFESCDFVMLNNIGLEIF